MAGARVAARRGRVPLLLGALAYLVALVQSPGVATSDTKIDLHVDPSRFLSQVASVWSPTAGLGHIQGGQYGGYLWPMGPFFALLHGIGLSPWLVQRLWLGTLLALAAWGTVRLLDALVGRERGAAHAVAGLVFMLNPYVVVFSNRTTITLLGYAALPWLMLVVFRGLRRPTGWWWPAAFGLILTSTGGGVNAAVTGWLLVGPVLLALYEALTHAVGWRDVRAFAWRTALASAAASIWWAVPVLVQASYGIDFLKFTEQVGSIWGTTSLPESLRLMGYWPSYLGVGYGDVLKSYFADSGTMLFDPVFVVASLLVPALALAGFAWTRRWRYGPFFVLLALVGLLIMSVGFPDGTPGRRGATFTYNHLQAIQFLRTTYKAGPLVALAIACLGGAAAARLWQRLGGAPARAVFAVVLVALVALAALPLMRGQAVELTWKQIPAAWRQAASGLDRELPPNSRAIVLPGQPFGFYDWGGTVDPILPTLTKRPVAIRNVPPYDDMHAIDMLWTVDNLVQQQRLLPGELSPMLSLMSARAVVSASDDDASRSGAMPPAEAALELAAQPGLTHPAKSYGYSGRPLRPFAAPPETIDPAERLPEVRRYDLPSARPLVRVEAAAPATVVDGSAEGAADLGALGGLTASAPLFYAGDLDAAELRTEAAAGAAVVITDSNRRRAFVASRSRQSVGWTLAADEAFSADAAVLNPFESRGADAQTVAVFKGARYVRAPYSPQIAQFPEHRPYAAFDGDPSTSWLADPTLDEARHYIEVGLDTSRSIPYVDLLPDESNPRVAVTGVDIDGRRFAVHPGWNHLPVKLARVATVRVTITRQRTRGNNSGSAGGFSEIRIPGVTVRELLRAPVLAETALAGQDLARTPLAYVFQRTTADEPFRRSPAPARPTPLQGNRAEAEAALVREAQDPETGISRIFTPPAARSWTVDGFATVSPTAPDPALDVLAGTGTGGARLTSSGRFEGRPGYRASAAFDGDPATAWTAPWTGPGSAWIAWRTSARRTVRGFRLVTAAGSARRPTVVRLAFAGGRTGPLPVGAGGEVTLPQPARSNSFRLDLLAARGGPPAVAIADLDGPGLPRVAATPRGSPVRGGCADLTAAVGGRSVALRAGGTVAAFDSGTALPVAQCGAPVPLAAATTELSAPAGVLRPYLLRLSSAAPSPLVRAAQGGGTVVDPGSQGRGSYSGVRLAVTGPSWLVLGESYNRGWRASCDGRSLGAPAVVDGFANGWRVGPGCRTAAFVFAPQRAVNWGYLVGALACLILLGVLVLGRRRRGGPPPAPAPLAADERPLRTGPRAAVGLGLIAAASFGFAFGLRAGAVVGPAVALILLVGVRSRTLVLAAGALLALVVPLLYVIFPGENRGGYDTQYPVEHLGAHWVTVGAFALLVLALARSLSTATRRREDDPGPSPEAAGERPARA